MTEDEDEGLTDRLDAQGPVDAALAYLSDLDVQIMRLWAWEQLEPAEIAVVHGNTGHQGSSSMDRRGQRCRASDRGRSPTFQACPVVADALEPNPRTVQSGFKITPVCGA